VRPGEGRAPVCAVAGRHRFVGPGPQCAAPCRCRWLRRKDSNLRRRWLTATRSTAELLRIVRTGSRHAPGGRMPAFLVCCPPQAHDPQDGPGCATPADGDPCRTRTCARCVSAAVLPLDERAVHVAVRKAEGSKPEASRPPPIFETGLRPLRQHLPNPICSRRSDSNGRPLPSEGSALFR
jgi:hypothetical protein